MGFPFRITGQKDVYMVTCTIVQWIDVLTKPVYTDIIVSRLKYYQQHKGLCIYGWAVMTNCVYIIASCKKGNELDVVLRAFKEDTSNAIVAAIETNENENRKIWMLWLLKQMGNINLWQQGNDMEEIKSADIFQQKLDFIHHAPIKAGWVDKPAEYRYSSARDMEGAKGLIALTEYQ